MRYVGMRQLKLTLSGGEVELTELSWVFLRDLSSLHESPDILIGIAERHTYQMTTTWNANVSAILWSPPNRFLTSLFTPSCRPTVVVIVGQIEVKLV